MGFFVLLGLAIVVGLVCLFIGLGATSSDTKLGGWGGFALVIVVFFGVTALMSAHTIENGHIGVVKQFGAVVGTTGDGFVPVAPWKSVSEVSVQNELRTFDMGRENSAVSQDSQPVFLIVQVNYSLQRDKAVDLYKETGGHFVDRILDPAVYQNTKEVTAKYKAIEFAKNRELIRLEIEKAINKEVNPHGLVINNVSLKNVGFTDDLSTAIEQTVEAEQQAKREEAKVKISTAQANQAVAKAEGEARSAIASANGQAKSVLINAQAEAKANRLKSRSLTTTLLQQKAIETLNPKVQVIICPPKQLICIPNANLLPVPTN